MSAPKRRTMVWSHVLVLVASLLYDTVSAKPKYVSVGLNAKWKSTPLLLEASEFVAQESNGQFWSLVDSIVDIPYDSYSDHNDKEFYELTIQYSSKVLSPLQVKLLKFALAMRAMSPTVEMYNKVANDKNPPPECEVFVDINNMITCEMGAITSFLSVAKNQEKPMILKNDHHYPSSAGASETGVVAVLYGDFSSEVFKKYHLTMKQLAEQGKIDYILRHFIKNPKKQDVRLSGYGVELAIKSTEYKAKDDTKVEGDKSSKDTEDEEEVEGFLFKKLSDLHPDLTDNLKEFKNHLIDSTKEMAQLKVWQLQDLSFQAGQRILSASTNEALRILRDTSQNFPTQAKSLVKVTVKDEFRQGVQANQKSLESQYGLAPGESAIFINGLQADLDIYDVFTLLETLRSEAKLLEGINQLGIKGQTGTNLLKLDMKQSDSNYALDVRNDAIQWVNDLEKDKRYSGWPSSVQEMLRPTFPGMLRHIRKNFFTIVFFVNPADLEFKDVLKMAEAFYVHNAPVRLGLVMLSDKDKQCDSDPSAALVCAYQYIAKEKRPSKGLSFLTEIYDRLDDEKLTAKFVQEEFSSDFPEADVDEVFADDSMYDQARKAAVEYHAQTGLGPVPQVLLNGVPMSKNDISVDSFEEAVVTNILKSTSDIQRMVYHGKLRDDTDVMDYLNTLPHVLPRLNAQVLSTEAKYLDLTQESGSKKLDAFKKLSVPQMTASIASSLKYMTKKDEESLRAVTQWIVADLDTVAGREFMYAAIKQLKHSDDVRLGIVHNPSEETNGPNIWKAIQAAIQALTPSMAKTFITKLVKEENVKELIDETKTLQDLEVHNMDFSAFEKSMSDINDDILKKHSAFCSQVLGFKPGDRGVITNGKILGPLDKSYNLILEDFSLLEKLIGHGISGKIKDEVQDLELKGNKGSDLIMKITSLLMSVPHKESRKEVKFAEEEHSVLKIAPKHDGPAYEVVAILDPTTRAAQKYTPLIMVLQDVVNVDIKVFMNCREKLSEMPLKSFYRYVLEPEVRFAVDSQLASGPTARFKDLPLHPILTLGMDPPESWLVESVKALHDLDNIVMDEVETNVEAQFELEYLLLEGHCFDAVSSQPPRGLQFVLGTANKRAVVDTIVMANLGYFQLKAKPGAWHLRLRRGPSSEIYEINGHEFTDSPPDSPEVTVVIDSFKSKIIRVKVNKKKGKENEDLLGAGSEDNFGLWDSISSSFGGTQPEVVTDKDDTLNIFSLASGHLYERFMRIMILSVLKHTKSKVKFWFLKNYLSPGYKDFIPKMAKEYGFEVELIQYKWPRWLHQQTEKQRIMWGYKILFLDVLFPLDVQKIIFVDADQIIRTDLQELQDFDLEGAPYGYTPFCSSRTEMDGFRFWKSGYWASHLAGRSYHISALYVVDLKKFRKIAAGDRLRGQYQGLSQDPNSLSNLDQDLPNNMIHQVAIKSLPQEWLWCETWCSEAEKTRAKTIDLCNNPQTKEPKLQAAMRIVPEWKDYDNEIKKFWDKIYKKDNTSIKDIPDKEKHEEL